MNPTVSAIGKMHFEGNVIPMGWFSGLTFENGKPNTVAIICLSEIIYWYRPAVVRDEYTGKVIEYRQKFKADKWQCHYAAMADRFGFTKDQVRNALHFLRDKGLITLDFRHIATAAGVPLSNVLFVEPVPDAIVKITYPGNEEGGVSYRKDTLPPQERHHPPTETDTYTETPKETPKEVGGETPDFDYLSDVVNRKVEGQNGKSGIAVPQDDSERWLFYRDKALAKYKELTGRYPDKSVGEPAISDLAALPDFDLTRWDASIRSCRLAGVNPGNIGCIIDTYKDGGDYPAMKQHERERERGQSPGKQEKPTIVVEGGKRVRVVK